MILQKMLLAFCKVMDWIFNNNFGRFSWGENGCGGSSITYLINWGPDTLCIRKGEVNWKFGACAVEAQWDGKGKLLYCKPKLMMREAGDTYYFGSKRTTAEYMRLEPDKWWERAESF